MAKKAKLQIPDSETGYSVSTTGTIHTRYAPHAGNAARTRTTTGVASLLDERDGTVCQVCFPPSDPAPQAKAEEPTP